MLSEPVRFARSNKGGKQRKSPRGPPVRWHFPGQDTAKLHDSRSSGSGMAEKLDKILESFVAGRGDTAGRDQLLGAAFVVVNKDGEQHERDMNR